MTPDGLTAFDRLTLGVAPRWTLERVRARAVALTLARHYDAAQIGRRTINWNRQRGDANAVIGVALAELRTHARDLIRNNGWARRGQRTIANNTVGWGIVPKGIGAASKQAGELWSAWADSTECDTEGRLNIAGIQHLAMKTISESGEILIRRRPRLEKDGLSIPLQLQVLEPDWLDTGKESPVGVAGGPVINGVEFDMLGRRVAYWLFDAHPGSTSIAGNQSRRIPATEILHVFYTERPGQARGISWFGTAVVPLKDFEDYEDATLLRQKIAACFAAFVTDDGQSPAIGAQSETNELVETLGPGMITQLPPGKQVSFGNPPVVNDDGFSERTLRKIAAGLGVTYEDLTGDYSQVNFSSARMARLAHWANVYDWQYNMLVPQLCDGVWRWAMGAAGLLEAVPKANWTCPPLPMIEPDREGLALGRLVRVGAMTPSAMVRQQGGDPEAHWEEYAADMKRLDDLKIKLDSDVRAVSQAGLTQERVGGAGWKPPDSTPQAAEDRSIDVDLTDDA